MKERFCKQWHRFGTITELLHYSCDQFRNEVLFEWDDHGTRKKILYSDWERDIFMTAKGLQSIPAKHIGIICDNSYECYLFMYSVMVAGKVAVMIEANLPEEQLQKYVQKADVEVLLYGSANAEINETICPAKNMKDLKQSFQNSFVQWPEWDSDRPACIVFTSGTGGEKCCVMLSQKNLASINALSAAGKVFSHGSVTIMFLPLYHAFAISIATVCIDCGAKMYLNRGVRYLQKEIQSVHPNFLVTVPMVNELFIKNINKAINATGKRKAFDAMVMVSNALRKVGIDLRKNLFKAVIDGLGGNLSAIISGGAAVPREMVDFFDDLGVSLLQGYGMTESTCAISMNTVTWNRSGSVGVVFPFNKVRIENEEIQISGDNVMLGYYKNDAENERVFDGEWMRTGDKGYFDRDGYLFISGRIKNLILLSNGENVSPEELEKEFSKSQYVKEILIMEKDKHIHAEIYPNEESGLSSQELSQKIGEEIMNFNKRNSVYKRIVTWNLRKEPFEKTGTLKIRRGLYV